MSVMTEGESDMSAMSRLATEIELYGWQHSAPALWTRTLAGGRLAAVWSYSSELGMFHKLFIDRDRGDFVTLDAAMSEALRIESIGVDA